jgi:hypothetical protein
VNSSQYFASATVAYENQSAADLRRCENGLPGGGQQGSLRKNLSVGVSEKIAFVSYLFL